MELVPSNSIEVIPTSQRYLQIHLKSDGDKLLLRLPKFDSQEITPEDWLQISLELKQSLHNMEKKWQSKAPVHLLAEDRLLDARHLQNLSQWLQDADLELTCIQTSRRQTAVAAATGGYSVEQIPLEQALLSVETQENIVFSEPLYLKNTVRSGVEVRYAGTVIILGDVNPGAEIIADGDILVWGSLRGVAHAGAKGNKESRIMALRIDPTQLRIAQLVARAPAHPSQQFLPEVAYISSQGIRITGAYQFAKVYRFDEIEGWIEKEST